MKIYTRTGDNGTTSLVYGMRVAKNDIRVEAYGTCDEANSWIGYALSLLDADDKMNEIKEVFYKIQTILFHVGAELSTPPGKEVQWKLEIADIEYLEQVIDEWNEKLPPLQNFILPGGHPAAAAFHVARTVVRRAERLAVGIDEVNPLVLAYLNRLSDLIFVTARYVNFLLNIGDKLLHN